MSAIRTVTATGVIAVNQAIIFSISATSIIDPASPPTGPAVISIHDSATADGSGDLLARLTLSQGQTSMDQLVFPAGARCGKGVTVIIVANGHTDLTISVDLA